MYPTAGCDSFHRYGYSSVPIECKTVPWKEVVQPMGWPATVAQLQADYASYIVHVVQLAGQPKKSNFLLHHQAAFAIIPSVELNLHPTRRFTYVNHEQLNMHEFLAVHGHMRV